MSTMPIPQGASVGDATGMPPAAPSSPPATAPATAGAMAIPQGATVGEPEATAPDNGSDTHDYSYANANRSGFYNGGTPDQNSGLVRGAEKGLAETMGGISHMMGGPGASEAETSSHGMAEHFGKGFETLVEFMGGMEGMKGLGAAEKLGELSKLIAPLQKYPRLGEALIRGILSGTVATGQTAAKGGSAAQAIGAGATTAAGGALLEGGLAALRKAGTAFSETEAAKRLTDAINPAAKKMSQFSASVTRQVGAIMDYAQRQGIDLTDRAAARANLAKAAMGAAEERAKVYYGHIKEFGDDIIGGREGAPGQTIRQLDSRLRSINDTPLEQQTPEMRGEAAQLRSTLDTELGKRLKVEPSQVGELRRSMGELKHVGNETTLALNKERGAINAQKSKPYKGSVSPLSENFIPDQAMRGVVNAAKGVPGNALGASAAGDREVADVFKHLQPAEAKPVARVEPSAAVKPRTEPTWKNQPGATSSIAEQQAARDAQRASDLKAQQARAAARQASRQQAQQKTQANAAAHGVYKTASDTDAMQRALDQLHPGKKFGDLPAAEQSKITLRAQQIKEAAAGAGR